MVSGYGKIDGRLVFVYTYDVTAHGGSLSETNAAKIVKVQQLALKNGAPVIAQSADNDKSHFPAVAHAHALEVAGQGGDTQWGYQCSDEIGRAHV